ncbi:histidine phosphatase family protein [Actinomycetospora chiangmaiensis]|uniref:histidine phosphatase family protein n=1 Tax=Actinomycetospora chiangmaiensis TaxID=402650 RepID=UPI0012F8C0E6|nr:histidine phosphatase family protein [Actinomycetospora chiangmaiensis]
MTTLVLARHGQTPANVAKTLDTRLPGPGLTDLGRLQAEALGKELAELGVTALYGSRARRAQETAGVVGTVLGLTPGAVDGVHEVQVGDLEGRSDDESVGVFRAVYDAWRAGDVTARMPGGESGQDVLDRYLPAVEDLRRRHPDETVVLVSHGAVLRLVGHALAGASDLRPDGDDHLDNCGRLEFGSLPDGGWRLAAWRREAPGGLASTRDATSG